MTQHRGKYTGPDRRIQQSREHMPERRHIPPNVANTDYLNLRMVVIALSALVLMLAGWIFVISTQMHKDLINNSERHSIEIREVFVRLDNIEKRTDIVADFLVGQFRNQVDEAFKRNIYGPPTADHRKHYPNLQGSPADSR